MPAGSPSMPHEWILRRASSIPFIARVGPPHHGLVAAVGQRCRYRPPRRACAIAEKSAEVPFHSLIGSATASLYRRRRRRPRPLAQQDAETARKSGLRSGSLISITSVRGLREQAPQRRSQHATCGAYRESNKTRVNDPFPAYDCRIPRVRPAARDHTYPGWVSHSKAMAVAPPPCVPFSSPRTLIRSSCPPHLPPPLLDPKLEDALESVMVRVRVLRSS